MMFDYYYQMGADLIPLRLFVEGDKRSKAPLMKNWGVTPYSPSDIEAFFNSGHSIGYRLKETDLVIDVDVATPDGHNVDGRESFERLCDDFNISLAGVPRVSSPSGGTHYYFRKPEGSKTVKKLKEYPGIDFLSKGAQVVAAGSRHWKGGIYELDFM
ncbi:MAG: hypothetical protein ACI814_005157 [Mariniblastus sp.]|jgi:hypothetical protein